MADAKKMRLGLPLPYAAGNVGLTSQTLDATTDQAEFIWQAPEAITITRIGIRVGTITGTTPTFKGSVQGVDGSGNSDGTIKGGGSPASKTFNPTSLGWSNNTWHWITLDNSYACTRGEFLSVVVAYDSGTINGSNSLQVTLGWASGHNHATPYAISNEAGSRTKQTVCAVFGLGSAGTAYGRPMLSITQQTFSSSTTPDEYALGFTLPSTWGSTFQVGGVEAYRDPIAAQNDLVTLYSGTTTLQDVTPDGDITSSASVPHVYEIFFDETSLTTLNFGSTYRVGITPQGTTSSGNTIPILEVESAADFEAYSGGQLFFLSTRTDAGAWTDTTTKRPLLGLIITDWSVSSGGGSSLVNGSLIQS